MPLCHSINYILTTVLVLTNAFERGLLPHSWAATQRHVGAPPAVKPGFTAMNHNTPVVPRYFRVSKGGNRATFSWKKCQQWLYDSEISPFISRTNTRFRFIFVCSYRPNIYNKKRVMRKLTPYARYRLYTHNVFSQKPTFIFVLTANDDHCKPLWRKVNRMQLLSLPQIPSLASQIRTKHAALEKHTGDLLNNMQRETVETVVCIQVD